MKLLTIAIPCYNSSAYMSKCIESLLPGGEDVEILIIDDGSKKDNTPEIADEYAAKYPTIIRAIHQQNKGHGGAVNTGIAEATGLYFKVVDSDDWVNKEAYMKLLNILREQLGGPTTLDMLISNYVYEKEGSKRKRVMHYPHAFPVDQLFGWKDVKPLAITHYVLMHSLIYRTALLRECHLVLPEHTFYVDNLVAFIPFPYVKTMYYADVNFYRYFIGRADQSVNEQVMIGRIDQQLYVNNEMIDYMGKQKNLMKQQRRLMLHSLEIIMTVSSVMLLRADTEESLKKKKELWKNLKKKDPRAYLHIRHGFTGGAMNLPGKGGRKVSITGYKLAQKLYGFN
ncbi:MAG: glycosyltransferase family 2 protein [Lachnospiraceae bacterium]|nr:glycosyltransferase family 2 protein [Lachnospiraceae bacterium]